MSKSLGKKVSKKIQTTKGYCIIDSCSDIKGFSVRNSEERCISDWCESMESEWEFWVTGGFSCVACVTSVSVSLVSS